MPVSVVGSHCLMAMFVITQRYRKNCTLKVRRPRLSSARPSGPTARFFGDPHVHSLPARHLAHLELLVGGAGEIRRNRRVDRSGQSNDDLQDRRRQRPEHLLSRGGPEQRARDPAAAWLSLIVPDVRYADTLARRSLSPDRARLSRLRK